MHTDVLIIGQGICGTMLSWFLKKEGKEFIIIDEGAENTSSKIAAGIINPVTGRRYVKTWMIEELLSFSKTTYSELSDYFGKNLCYTKSIIDFFPSAQMRNSFLDRLVEDNTYLHTFPDQNFFNDYFNYDFGCGEICPAYIVDVQFLLSAWRNKIIGEKRLVEEEFVSEELQITTDGVKYQSITAGKIVFCDGIASVKNQWFQLLPFSPNKGEALKIVCEALPTDYIFKKGLVLAPLSETNTYWVGSNYQWEFENEEPSLEFYDRTKELLNHWVKIPYEIVDHKAAVRPATLERRPFVGFHPFFEQVGILNGMGTKGTSLAPFFAHQLAQNIVNNFPIADEANVHRFSRILSKFE